MPASEPTPASAAMPGTSEVIEEATPPMRVRNVPNAPETRATLPCIAASGPALPSPMRCVATLARTAAPVMP